MGNISKSTYDDQVKKNNSLKDDIEKLNLSLQKLIDNSNKPINDFKNKINEINNMSIKCNITKKTLLCGPKGAGKNTFLWLCGLAIAPTKSLTDGTVDIIYSNLFIDIIGIDIDPNQLYKLLVVLLCKELPSDMILFSNDRVIPKLHSLSSSGITSLPIICCLNSTFWKDYNKGKIDTKDDNDMDMIYDLDTYRELRDTLGVPVITHKNLILIEGRKSLNIFQNVKDLFRINNNQLDVIFEYDIMDSNFTYKILFKYLYIYAKIYNRNDYEFISKGKIEDFI